VLDHLLGKQQIFSKFGKAFKLLKSSRIIRNLRVIRRVYIRIHIGKRAERITIINNAKRSKYTNTNFMF
jgi:hypothetical protein